MKVFINPGHSKNCTPDAGCCYNDIKEAQICAEIANFLADELLKSNIHCVVYQQTGEGLTSNQQLNTITKEANASGADLFISIHMNGHSNANACGTEVWYEENSVKGKAFASYLLNELTQPFDRYSLSNRGIKASDGALAVLRDTSMPAALAEICFISNRFDADFIKINRKNVAKRLAQGIKKFCGITCEVTAFPTEFKLEHVEDDKYDLYVNGQLVLAANKFSTCISYMEKQQNE